MNLQKIEFLIFTSEMKIQIDLKWTLMKENLIRSTRFRNTKRFSHQFYTAVEESFQAVQ